VPIVWTPIALLKSLVVQWGRVPAPVPPSQMIVSPVLGSRAIFDQSVQGLPIVGALANADVVVGVVVSWMVGGVVAVGGGGTTGSGVGEVVG
jgi:hypothetical protein